MTDFELRVGANRYAGWKSLSLKLGIEQLAHSFNVSLTDRWSENSEPVPIEGGDTVEVLIDRKTITNGYVDDDSVSYDARSRSLSFSGRSKTCDLVDCSAVRSPGFWRNVNLETIAKDLCDPFGIDVIVDAPQGEKFKRFGIEEGETGFDCISRAARRRGLLMLTNGDGNLVLDRSGTSKISTVLEYGVNILRGNKRNSMRSRYSQYILKTQSAGTDEDNGKNKSITRTSEDAGVERYRPLVIVGDQEESGTELQKRADWERNVRAGRAKRLMYDVAGWYHEDGLWGPNRLVVVSDPETRTADELLISSVTFQRGEQGTITSLELSIKEAFDVEPLPRPKRKKGAVY